MNSTIYTLTMLGLGGGSDQYLFLTMGLAASSAEPPALVRPLLLLLCGG